MKLLIAVALLASASCGWHHGLVAPDSAPDARTVGVQIFGNETLEPGLEADLSKHLSKALVDYVQLDLSSPNSADLLVRGTVTSFRRRNGIRSEINELLEGSVRVELTAELVHRRDKRVLKQVHTGLWAEYATGNPALNSPGSGEGPARERLLQNLASRLVLELFEEAD